MFMVQHLIFVLHRKFQLGNVNIKVSIFFQAQGCSYVCVCVCGYCCVCFLCLCVYIGVCVYNHVCVLVCVCTFSFTHFFRFMYLTLACYSSSNALNFHGASRLQSSCLLSSLSLIHLVLKKNLSANVWVWIEFHFTDQF